MMSRFRLAVPVAVAAAIFGSLLPSTADADERVCEWDSDARAHICKIVRRAEAGGPARSVDIDGPGPLPLIWSRTLSNGLPGATFTCYVEETIGGVVNEVFGVGWAVFITNSDTGEMRLAGFDCEYPGEDPPQPPPPPPTPGEIVEESRAVVELTTGLSPSAARRGVSQLETWLWCEGAQTTTLNPSLGGYEIKAEIGLESVVWAIDGPDGAVTRSAEVCGSAPAATSDGFGAAARWTPNEAGVSAIVQTAMWGGTWSLTYTDPALGTFDLGTFPFPSVPVVSEPISYEVYEIQSVGVGP